MLLVRFTYTASAPDGTTVSERASVVALAQPAEHRIVAPKVTGSSPVGHPNHTIKFAARECTDRQRPATDLLQSMLQLKVAASTWASQTGSSQRRGRITSVSRSYMPASALGESGQPSASQISFSIRSVGIPEASVS